MLGFSRPARLTQSDSMEARAALALEAHIRATPDLLIRASREGRQILPQAP